MLMNSLPQSANILAKTYGSFTITLLGSAAFVALNEELAKVENDVGEAVESFLDNIASSLGLPNLFDFTQERIQEKLDPEELDPNTKCPLYNIKTKTQACFPRACKDWCAGIPLVVCTPLCFVGCKEVCTEAFCLPPITKLIAERVPLKVRVKVEVHNIHVLYISWGSFTNFL